MEINPSNNTIKEFIRFNASCEPQSTLSYDAYDPLREPLCGRPLGMRLDGDYVWVAESYSGLYKINLKTKTKQLMVDRIEGRKITLINDVEVYQDQVFFTESSDRWGRNKIISEIMATRPCGTFVVYETTTNTLKVFKGFLPTNGLTLSHDRKFVYFVSSPRIYRFERATEKITVALDGAPGLLDNIRKRKGVPNRYLVGAASKRSQPFSIPDLLAKLPGLRNILFLLLPQTFFLTLIPRMGLLLEIDLSPGQERVVRSWQDRSSNGIAYVSEAEELDGDGYTYLGSWHENHLVRVKTSILHAPE